MKTIIGGSRNIDDYTQLCRICENEIITEVVSGTAKGADTIGERYAEENGIPIKRYPAAWATYGKAAGVIRNAQMAKYADVLIAMWDGKSKGTENMIKQARKHGLKVKVVIYG